MDVITPIANGIDILLQGRRSGQHVVEFAEQEDMFVEKDRIAAAMAGFMDQHKRSSKRMGAGFTETDNGIEGQLTESQNEDMFSGRNMTANNILETAN